MSGVVADKKPWFGPKRVGWGLRPTSWQGWVLLLVVVAAFVLVRVLLVGR